MSRANNIAEETIDKIKSALTSRTDEKLPCETIDIVKEYDEIISEYLPFFCESVNSYLSPKQSLVYIMKIIEETKVHLLLIVSQNELFFEEWFDISNGEIKRTLQVPKLTSLSEVNTFTLNLTSEWNRQLNKLSSVPNTICQSMVNFLLNLLNEGMFETVKVFSNNVLLMASTEIKSLQQNIDITTDNGKKTLGDLATALKTISLLSDEKTALLAKNIRLESALEKAEREIKNKGKENEELLKIEHAKLIKNESYFEDLLKSKDSIIEALEWKVDNLSKNVYELNKELTNKSLEMNRENTKLTVELEQVRGKEKSKGSESGADGQESMRILFKTMQASFAEFKESVDKLDREKENLVNR